MYRYNIFDNGRWWDNISMEFDVKNREIVILNAQDFENYPDVDLEDGRKSFYSRFLIR